MSGAPITELVVRIGTDVRELERLNGKVQSEFNKVGESVSRVGAGLSLAVTAPILAFGASAISAGANFEEGMNKVKALSGATGEDLEMLTNRAKELGSSTKFSASQAADAMSFLAMAGFDTAAIYEAMPSVLNAAAAGNMDLAESADIVSNIMTGFGMTADETAGAVDILVAGFTNANTDLSQLGSAMSYVAPVARSLGMDFGDVTTAIGLMSNAGIQGDRAGTSLRGALARLAAPTDKVTALLGNFGLTMDASKDGMVGMFSGVEKTVYALKDMDGNLKPIPELLKALEASGMDAGTMMTIFGQRAGPGMLAMIDQGMPAFEELRQTLEDSGGSAEYVAGTMQEGLKGAVTELKSAMEGLQIAISGAGIQGVLETLVDTMSFVIRAFTEAPPWVMNLGVAVGALAAAIGPLLFITGKLMVMFGPGGTMTVGLAAVKAGFATVATALGPVGLAIAAVVAAVALLILNWEEVTGWMGERFPKVVEAFKAIWGSLQDAFARVGEAFEGVGGSFGTVSEFIGMAIKGIYEVADTVLTPLVQLFGFAFGNMLDGVVMVFELMANAWKTMFSVFGNIFEAAFNVLTGNWGAAWDNIKAVFGDIWVGIKEAFKIGLKALINMLPGWAQDMLGLSDAFEENTELSKKALEDMAAATARTATDTGADFASMDAALAGTTDATAALSEETRDAIAAMGDEADAAEDAATAAALLGEENEETEKKTESSRKVVEKTTTSYEDFGGVLIKVTSETRKVGNEKTVLTGITRELGGAVIEEGAAFAVLAGRVTEWGAATAQALNPLQQLKTDGTDPASQSIRGLEQSTIDAAKAAYDQAHAGGGGLAGAIAETTRLMTGAGGWQGAIGAVMEKFGGPSSGLTGSIFGVVNSITGGGGIGGAVGGLLGQLGMGGGLGGVLGGAVGLLTGEGGFGDAVLGVAGMIPGIGTAITGVTAVLDMFGIDAGKILDKVAGTVVKKVGDIGKAIGKALGIGRNTDGTVAHQVQQAALEAVNKLRDEEGLNWVQAVQQVAQSLLGTQGMNDLGHDTLEKIAQFISPGIGANTSATIEEAIQKYLDRNTDLGATQAEAAAKALASLEAGQWKLNKWGSNSEEFRALVMSMSGVTQAEVDEAQAALDYAKWYAENYDSDGEWVGGGSEPGNGHGTLPDSKTGGAGDADDDVAGPGAAAQQTADAEARQLALLEELGKKVSHVMDQAGASITGAEGAAVAGDWARVRPLMQDAAFAYRRVLGDLNAAGADRGVLEGIETAASRGEHLASEAAQAGQMGEAEMAMHMLEEALQFMASIDLPTIVDGLKAAVSNATGTGDGGAPTQTINVNMDGATVASVVAENLPEVVNVTTGRGA